MFSNNKKEIILPFDREIIFPTTRILIKKVLKNGKRAY